MFTLKFSIAQFNDETLLPSLCMCIYFATENLDVFAPGSTAL